MASRYCEECFGNTYHDDTSRSINDTGVEVHTCTECGKKTVNGK